MTLLESNEGENKVESLHPMWVQAELGEPVRTQEHLHDEVLKQLTANHAGMWASARKGMLSNFEVGDYAIVVRVQKPGPLPKSVSTWRGSWMWCPR